FFSSRRRHTRSDRDWSSDVCSSDLPRRSQGAPRLPASRPEMAPPTSQRSERPGERVALLDPALLDLARLHQQAAVDRELGAGDRSEERRVGKECRAGWVREYGRKKK